MTIFAQLVVGPAGSGKSTYCHTIQQHFEIAMKKTCRVVNLDPACEAFRYECFADVRDLVTVDDVQEACDLGPNGGLVHAMEFLAGPDGEEWLEEEVLASLVDDDYLVLDCPGQIELYAHLSCFQDICKFLAAHDVRICCVYCVDASVCVDAGKFVAAALSSLSCMTSLELPHVNVLTKCDLVANSVVGSTIGCTVEEVASRLNAGHQKYAKLNVALAQVLDSYSIVQWMELDQTNEDSIGHVLMNVNHVLQYGEALDVDDRAMEAAETAAANAMEA